jgi:hypothetical protein
VPPRFPSGRSLYRTPCPSCVFTKINSFGSEPTARSRRAFPLAKSRRLCRIERASLSARLGSTRRSRRALTEAKSVPRAAPSGFHLWSNQDRRDAPGVRLLRPNRGLVPRQADFLFGQIRTDVTLQACAYSGQIRASCRVKRASSSVKSGPTRRSRRALTQAKSGPRAASSGLPLRSRR